MAQSFSYRQKLGVVEALPDPLDCEPDIKALTAFIPPFSLSITGVNNNRDLDGIPAKPAATDLRVTSDEYTLLC
jgi:hypothetical protein